jgi:hypothetical protein
MYCPNCGQQNKDEARFCVKCGTEMLSVGTLMSPSLEPKKPSNPISRDTNQVHSASERVETQARTELKDSGTVTAMSVVGFVFGLIGMLGSFIPCIGSLAFYVGIPAAIISGIALGIAYSQNAKKSFAIVALTISLIGVTISGWQYFSIISAGNRAERELKTMFGKQPYSQPSGTGARQSQVNPTKLTSAENDLADKFCGIWEYDDSGAKQYLKIIKEAERFKFDRGYKYDGVIVWEGNRTKNENGIYLKLSNGKLVGEFISCNFYPTHAEEFTYKITLELKSNNRLHYTVYWSIRGGETVEKEAIKISD